MDGGSRVQAALGTLAMARAEPGQDSLVWSVYPISGLGRWHLYGLQRLQLLFNKKNI